jgi:taurine--2-oxoglutarate transaminase
VTERARGPDLARRQRELVFSTWSAQNRPTPPFEIVAGEGARFTTADGAGWIDLGSMTWNANLGHGHPRMKAALAAAAGRGLLAYPSSVFPDKVRAGELLAEVTPRGLDRSFICLSGAEANENAVKMARMVTGRQKIVARTRSYHGATLAMLSLSGDPRREPFEPGLPGIVRTVDPYCYRCPVGRVPETCAHQCADDLDAALRRAGPDTVAAVIMEGIVGANGVFVPPPGYWRKVRDICDRHGVLLIADEVLSGFGRTGRWFAVDHDGVTPDLLTMAKGLTGGYAPGGAVIVSDAVARHFDENVLYCGLTTYAHPLICAAIVAAIESYRDEALVPRAAALGAWWGPRLAELARTRPIVGDVRGIGLLWALELVVPGTRTPLDAEAVARVAAGLRRRHVHLHKRENQVYLAPPLVTTEADLTEGLALVGEALDEAGDGGAPSP